MEPNGTPDRSGLANTADVSAYLKVPAGTLDQWAHRNVGPRFIKVGRHRRYRWADVDAWLEQNASTPNTAA